MRPTRREDARGPAVDVVIASTRWNKTPHAAKLVRRTIAAAAPVRTRNAELSVVLASNRTTAALNRQWRGQDRPTNVLSFPAPKRAHSRAATRGAPRHLGDIVIAYETTAAEARAERKAFDHHLAHLAVHGFLHLLGYDHESRAEAEAMERRERRILARLGVPDPYAARDADD
jgi:probable rRNA maturation factor